MKCPECGSDNREGVKFCEECGSRMEMVCPSCSAILPLGKKFCGECGQKLSSPKIPLAVDYSRPKSYTPKFMAEKILTTRSALEGERKLLTVFFADVANFTSLSERLDPEEVHQIMDGCFKILLNEIHKYEGTINQFTGDGVMALFGAPLAHEDHAQRACYAALAIQKAVKIYDSKITRDYGVEFKIRIGLNSGPVVVGAIGDDLRMDYTAIGDTTNLGARMESLAKPGSTLLSANTYKIVKDYFLTTSLGKVDVKGKKEPQNIYELSGTSQVVTRIDASKAKGLTKFIGRQSELDILLETFEKARGGTGQVVGIVGEAGVGKSRLLLELRRELKGDYGTLEGRCLEFWSSIPFLPILDLLRTFFDIKEGDPEDRIKPKIRDRITGLDKNLLEGLPAFHDLLSLTIEDHSWQQFEPGEKRLKTFEALRDLLIWLSDNQPLLLVLDDLHWMDRTSEEFLDYLIRWLAPTRILLLLLYRPEYDHPWSSRSFFQKIGLDQLSMNNSAELVRSMFEEGLIAPELSKLILRRSAGNPLFMEELTRTLLESGHIEKRDGKYTISGDTPNIQLPNTVQGIIAARMDRLEDHIKRAMQIASVIGRDFTYRILQAITDKRDELKSCLMKLQGLEFIYEKQLFPELEYIFKHAVTQEVAYGSLLLGRRKELHGKIGRTIEEIYPTRLDEFTEVLAYHYARSDDIEKAYDYLRSSGEKATRNNSAWEAFGYYKEALRTAGKYPDEEDGRKLKLEALHLMFTPMIFLGLPENSLSILREGEENAKALGDEKSLIRIYSNTGLFHSTRGRYDKGRTYIKKAFEAARKTGDVELMAQTVPEVCLSMLIGGQYGRVIDVASNVAALIEKRGGETDNFGGPTVVYPGLLAFSGYAMGLLGNFSEGLELCGKSVAGAFEAESPSTSGICQLYHGLVFVEKGEVENAETCFKKSIANCDRAEFLQPLSLSWSNLGYVYALLGDPEKGLDCIEKGLKVYRDSDVEWHMANHLYCQGFCYFETGAGQTALNCMKEALESSKKNQGKFDEGRALIWIGRIGGKSKNTEESREAENSLLKGIRIFETLKVRPSLSQGMLFLGELYAEKGQDKEALGILKKVKTEFEKMDMAFWTVKTEEIISSFHL